MTAIVVDANVFKLFYDSLIAEIDSEATSFVSALFIVGHIAFDDKGAIQHEWRETCCGAKDEFFKSWIAGRLLENKIRLYSDCCHPHSKKAISKLGVPNRDRKYLFLAASSLAPFIFSEDIDMYEPKAKRWPERKKREIKNSGKGCVCVWMLKNHGTRIYEMSKYVDAFATL